MKIKRIWAAYFSPTGGTKRMVNLIAHEFEMRWNLPVNSIDFTLPQNRKDAYQFAKDDLLIIGTPVYAGRIPNKILPDVERLFEGCQTPAIAVSVFGNRNFDDALMELTLTLSQQGFTVFAAAALANRHVFSDKIASERPDQTDLEEITLFAQDAFEKLSDTDSLSPVAVAGNNPIGPYYTPLGIDGKPAKFLKAKPVTDSTLCTQCGSCATVCPMGSIDADDCTKVSGICIKCQACIRICPTQAKKITDEAFLSHVQMLEANYTKRADNHFFYNT